MKQSKVLVVGSGGFIGTNLMKGRTNWDSMDLKDGRDFCEAYIKDYEVIVLLAARLDHTKYAYRHNFKIYDTLIDYLLRRKEQPHIIFMSSAAVYNAHTYCEEDFDIGPSTIYGKSKLLGEEIIEAVADSYTILRLANVFGNGDGNGVIDKFIRGGRTIYGDGSQVRDYVPVKKVVQAIEKIVADPTKFKNQIYNISTGVGMTVLDVFGIYGKGEPEAIPGREFDVQHSVLSNKKATEAGLV